MANVNAKGVIITGAGSGIGRATALLFAKNGAKVTVVDIDEKGGGETAEMIKRAKGQALFVRANVTKNVDVQNVVGKTLSAFGGIQVLHNNAGLWRVRDTIEEVSEEEWKFVVDVNLNAVFLMTRAVFPLMKQMGGGCIIHTSSSGAYNKFPTGLSYTAAKAGVLAFSRSLAALGAPHKVRSNAICPGAVDTPAQKDNPPAMREAMKERGLLKPEDIARAALYLATTDSMNGEAINVQLQDGRARYLRLKDVDLEPLKDL